MQLDSSVWFPARFHKNTISKSKSIVKIEWPLFPFGHFQLGFIAEWLLAIWLEKVVRKLPLSQQARRDHHFSQ